MSSETGLDAGQLGRFVDLAEPAPGSGLSRRLATADRWVNRAAATTVAGLAGVAGAVT